MHASAMLKTLYRTVTRTIDDGVTDLASSIAFFVCFGVFPFLLAILSAAGWWMDQGDFRERFAQYLEAIIPANADLVLTQIEAIMQARGSMGVAGVVALLWSASAAFGAIMRALNRAQGAENPYPYVITRLRYFVMAVLSSLLVTCAVSVSAVSELLFTNRELLVLVNLDYRQLSRIGIWLSTFGIMFAVFAMIYRVAPYQRLPWRFVWPGALLAAVFNEVAKFCFIWYIGHVSSMELVFGSLTAIMVLLMWFYVAGIGLVVGFEFNLVLAAEGEGR